MMVNFEIFWICWYYSSHKRHKHWYILSNCRICYWWKTNITYCWKINILIWRFVSSEKKHAPLRISHFVSLHSETRTSSNLTFCLFTFRNTHLFKSLFFFLFTVRNTNLTFFSLYQQTRTSSNLPPNPCIYYSVLEPWLRYCIFLLKQYREGYAHFYPWSWRPLAIQVKGEPLPCSGLRHWGCMYVCMYVCVYLCMNNVCMYNACMYVCM